MTYSALSTLKDEVSANSNQILWLKRELDDNIHRYLDIGLNTYLFFIINILRTLRITARRGHQLPPAPNGDLKGHILKILGAMTLHAIMPDKIVCFSRE